MKDYASMSDFEINKRVADIAMNGTWHVKPSHPDNDTGGWLYGSNGIQTHELPDYCNNPADAWPILLDNEISLVKWQHDDVWAAWSGAGMAYGEVECEYVEHDENPLRAGMIVFLMMKESEK